MNGENIIPLEAVGEKKDHVVALARVPGKKTLIVLVPRLVVGLTGGVEHPPLGRRMLERYARFCPPFLERAGFSRNLFTEEEVQVEEERGICGLAIGSVLRNFPVGAWESMGNPR